jgi:ubiquitin C-terminal hydrolase
VEAHINLDLTIKNSIEECLIDLNSIERLDANYVCDSCLTNGCTKQIKETKLDKYLLLRFKRFNRFGDKLSDSIKIPE